MTNVRINIGIRMLMATIALLFVTVLNSMAQTLGDVPLDSAVVRQQLVPLDSVEGTLTAEAIDSIAVVADSMVKERSVMLNDTIMVPAKVKEKRDWSKWRPNPQRALWLALIFPGGGQIYNRKYWKLPIVYGGFIGCIYAMSWNSMMYKDYQQAYIDIMDDDPNTASYNKFLHLGRKIDKTNEERYKQIFKSRKDKYRRWRDLSFFVMVGIYALSVIDAYVDAELSEFDISKDLSLKVRPTMMNNGQSPNPLYATSVGVNCSINF